MNSLDELNAKVEYLLNCEETLLLATVQEIFPEKWKVMYDHIRIFRSYTPQAPYMQNKNRDLRNAIRFLNRCPCLFKTIKDMPDCISEADLDTDTSEIIIDTIRYYNAVHWLGTHYYKKAASLFMRLTAGEVDKIAKKIELWQEYKRAVSDSDFLDFLKKNKLKKSFQTFEQFHKSWKLKQSSVETILNTNNRTIKRWYNNIN